MKAQEKIRLIEKAVRISKEIAKLKQKRDKLVDRLRTTDVIEVDDNNTVGITENGFVKLSKDLNKKITRRDRGGRYIWRYIYSFIHNEITYSCYSEQGDKASFMEGK